MKDFFTQMMKDLYALTGIEQVRWMLNDHKDGERNFDLCIEGMVQAAKMFAYIPEPQQQKIIRKMMLEDKDYTGLNSRTIYKWLALHKDVYWQDQSDYKEPEHEPAPPEVADKYIEEFKRNLEKVGSAKTVAPNINQVRRDHEHTTVTGKEYIGYAANLQQFICDGIQIPAVDESYARKQYREAFGKEPIEVKLFSPKGEEQTRV